MLGTVEIIKSFADCGFCDVTVIYGVVKLCFSDGYVGSDTSGIGFNREDEVLALEEGVELIVELKVGGVDWTVELAK